MTKTIVTTNPSVSSDATFRTWGSTLSAGLATAGLVQTADTGQINWASVTRPAGGSTSAGYEIWRFNDALQATKPIFFKISYATGVANTTACIQNIQVGTGSNGSGTITGPNYTFAGASFTSGGAATNANADSYFTHVTSGAFSGVWNFQGYSTSTIPAMALVIDRTRDSSGTATGDGVYMLCGTYNGTVGAHTPAVCINFTTATVYGPIQSLAAFPDLASTAGGDIYLAKHYAFIPGVLPSIAGLTYNYNDMTALTIFTSTTFGSHDYIAMGRYTFQGAGNNGPSPAQLNTAATNEMLAVFAMVWEN